ncbi:hypothetical protein MTR_3g062350 [Medicago truncatula]|uniref:Uncharacterized protein n=1 Tax=Medicago truncatula TaxID=3880 RepID=G7IV32_MEDTR|nr:hypothetical protein MTR_3g062350 [Medicago truncatula]
MQKNTTNTSILGGNNIEETCCNGCEPVDGGVRLFKCYISTCVPLLRSGDIFNLTTKSHILGAEAKDPHLRL